MNNPYIYYKDQCKYCLKKGKCYYQKKRRCFLTQSTALNIWRAESMEV